MKIAICLEKSGGFSFNNRRLSQDAVIQSKISESAGDGRVCLNRSSSKLFQTKDNLAISENFISESSGNDICFIENMPLPDLEKVSMVYLFKWNRDYPADKYFSCDLLSKNFKKVKTENLIGNSHKKITLEIYERR